MKKSSRQLDYEIAQALSGKSRAARTRTRASGRPVHATKAKGSDKGSDKITIDQLAKMLNLPDWEKIDEMNQHHYWEMTRGGKYEDEDAQMKAEQEAQDEVYRQWYDAVEHAAEQILGQHGLGLLAMKHTRKVNQNYRPHVLKIVASKSWSDAADKMRETVNGVGGTSHYDTLGEFLDSGPYTARQAVLSHLGYIKRYPDVYGSQSARQLYEQHWR